MRLITVPQRARKAVGISYYRHLIVIISHCRKITDKHQRDLTSTDPSRIYKIKGKKMLVFHRSSGILQANSINELLYS